MEIRVLEYFLAVAREESITGAAAYLNMTQPPLSRQLRELEEELGIRLFERGNRKITLTEQGMVLRKRAEEIIDLVEKAKKEVAQSDEDISGDVYIGGGETEGMRPVAAAIERIRRDHPRIEFHLYSDNAQDVTERLDRGLLDFGVVIEPADMTKYNYIKLPGRDVWGC